MMHARWAAGSRLSARSSSCLTISRTSSCVTTLLSDRTSSDISGLLCRRSAGGPDHREHAGVGPGDAAAFHLRHEPVAGQTGPFQCRLVRAPPEVAGLDRAAAADGREVLHVDDAEQLLVDLLPGVQLLAPDAVERRHEHAQ